MLTHNSLHMQINTIIVNNLIYRVLEHWKVFTVQEICTCFTFQTKTTKVINWKHFTRYWAFVRGIHRLPVTRSFDVFCDQHLNKRSGIQSWDWKFETPSRSLWRHSNDTTTLSLNCYWYNCCVRLIYIYGISSKGSWFTSHWPGDTIPNLMNNRFAVH